MSTAPKHTPEPWSHNVGDPAGDPTDSRIYSGDCSVTEATGPADAARIVACVNACAGITDPAATLAEVRKTLERCIMALAANGAPNCEAAKESRAALAKLGKG